MLNEVSGFFAIIFINFLFSWVLMIFQFWFKKFKKSIYLQFNFTLDDSLFFQNFLWVSISFCFQIRIFFPFRVLIFFFFFFTFEKIMILFPFRILIAFVFCFSDIYSTHQRKKTSNSLVRMACDCIKCGYPIDRC